MHYLTGNLWHKNIWSSSWWCGGLKWWLKRFATHSDGIKMAASTFSSSTLEHVRTQYGFVLHPSDFWRQFYGILHHFIWKILLSGVKSVLKFITNLKFLLNDKFEKKKKNQLLNPTAGIQNGTEATMLIAITRNPTKRPVLLAASWSWIGSWVWFKLSWKILNYFSRFCP